MLLFFAPEMYLLGMSVWLACLGGTLWWSLRCRRRYRDRSTQRWIHLGLSIWFLFAGLTVPEVWYAACVDQSDSFNASNISQRWFQRHVRLNPQGFRDAQPFTRSVPNGKRRLAFVGDSFTFGHGVNRVADRFSDQVGTLLETQAPGRYVVANLGIPGTGTNDLVPLWKQHVLQPDARVDVAIVTICLNDIEWFARDNLEQNLEIQRLKPSFFLFRDTYFYNQFYLRLQLMQKPAVRDYYSYVRDYYRGSPWEKMRQALLEFRTLLRRNQTELRLVVFPFLHNLGPDYPFTAVHEQLVTFARDHDIPVLDLAPVLQPHSPEGLTVNRFDAHPNVLAHHLAARAIVEKLLSDLAQPFPAK